MLKLIHKISALSYSDLMAVYSQSIRENGEKNYPYLDSQSQILESEQDLYTYLQLFFQTPGAYMGIWIQDEHYVSAARVEPFRDGVLITALETAPAKRGKGYATALLSELTNAENDSKLRFYSHISKDNLSSLAVHRKAGFTLLSNNAHYLDGSVDHTSFTLLKEIKRNSLL